jgi:alkyl hydroperoxide reductase subunit F
MAVPTVLLNGETFGQGRMSVDEILAKLDTGAAARQGRPLAARSPTMCWWWAAARPARPAAIYAARKGIAPASWPSASAARCIDTMASRT